MFSVPTLTVDSLAEPVRWEGEQNRQAWVEAAEARMVGQMSEHVGDSVGAKKSELQQVDYIHSFDQPSVTI